MGYVESLAMFQTYKKKDLQCAEDLLRNTQKRSPVHTHMLYYSVSGNDVNILSALFHRFMEEMKAVSPDTEIEQTVEYFCILASKPI